MNIVGGPPLNCGFTIAAAPTELKAFTSLAAGNSPCRRSISESSSVVKNFSTPFTGGASAIGFVTSMTVLPVTLFAPAARKASAATDPFTARTTTSPNFAVSAKLPMAAFGCSAAQPASLSGWRVPTRTS